MATKQPQSKASRIPAQRRNSSNFPSRPERIALSSSELRILRALLHAGPVDGETALAELSHGQRLVGIEGALTIIEYAQAARRLARLGLITATATPGDGRAVEYCIRKMPSKRAPGQRPRSVQVSSISHMRHASTVGFGLGVPFVVGATSLIAGCMSMSYPLPSHQAYSELQGLMQSVDGKSGKVTFTSCNPCAGPTPKTTASLADRQTKSTGGAFPADTTPRRDPQQLAKTYAPEEARQLQFNPAFSSLFNKSKGAPRTTGGLAASAAAPSPAHSSGPQSSLEPVKQLAEKLGQPVQHDVVKLAASSTNRATIVLASTTPPTAGGAAPMKMDTTFASVRRIVPFTFGASALTAEGRKLIDELAPAARLAQRVIVRGRTDGTGDPTLNEKLALNRAISVRNQFMALNVEPAKIRAVYCTTCFAADNVTETGRSANRRVEVELVMPAGKVAAIAPSARIE